MHQIFNNGLLKLKNMDWFSIYAYLSMHFCVCFLFGISCSDSMHDILKWYEHRCKRVIGKKS
jgi:hypothetical protein